MYDLMKAGAPFDNEQLDRHLIRHSSGVKVLIAPTRPDQASAVSIDFLREIYASLRTMCDAIIVDTPPGFTPEVIATIDVSSEICMIGMLDSLSLKNTKLGLETLDLMGYDPAKIRLVLNRADSRVGITRDDVHAIVGRPPDVLVPSHRDIPRSVNVGVPLVLSDIQGHLAQEGGIARDDRERLITEIADDILGHGPLERLLADETITEIMVNGPHDIWIERGGRLHQTPVRFNDDSHLRRIINKMV